MATRLIEIVESLPKARVALIGDLMVDRYLYGNAERLSPEAPVPVLHYQREEVRLGGCGSVAADLAALGCNVRLVGLAGNDAAGKQLREKLAEAKIDPGLLVEEEGRPTTCKLRLVGSAQHRHPQQLMRLDFEQTRPAAAATADKLVENARKALESADVLAIEDYNKGTVPPEVLRRLIEIGRNSKKPVIVDPAMVGDYSRYAGASAIKLNRYEAGKASGLPVETPGQFGPAARKLLEILNVEAVILTLDREGAYLAVRGGEDRWLNTKARQVFDVTGAGDMVLAMTAAARAVGASWEETVALANVAGGLEVERFGSVPVHPDEIIRELLSEVRESLGKQRTLEQLAPELQRHRAMGKRVVFTNGCFDLIHLGHVKYFQFARNQGDLLLVGVNTDASIRRLKGDSRPIVGETDRLGVLEELESIDYLVTFDQDTPLNLIRMIRPDVLVKGQDYEKKDVVGANEVESWGGKVALAPLVDGRSTSTMIRRILEVYGGQERK